MPGHTPGTGADRGDAGGGPLLVAVSLDSSPAVVRCAAQAALRLLVDLVVVHVDEARGPRFTRPDGTVVMLPIDPDLPDDVNAASIRSLRATVEETLAVAPISWRWEERCGPAARVLAELADELDSPCIVLGAPHQGLLHALARLAEESVTTQLARHQVRPVLVVPSPDPTTHRHLRHRAWHPATGAS